MFFISFKKIILLNIFVSLIVTAVIAITIDNNYTNRTEQRLKSAKDIINLKIGTFITETNSISESLTTILSNSNDEKFINQFLEDNHTRYAWMDHIYILDDKKKIIYDSKGKGSTQIKDYKKYKYKFPFSSEFILTSKSSDLKNSKTLLLSNKLNIRNRQYIAVVQINVDALQNEIGFISNRFNVEVNGIDGTQIYEIGPQNRTTKSLSYLYQDLPIMIKISLQYKLIERIIIPSILIFLVIFLVLTLLALIYKTRLERLEHEKLIEQANNEKFRLIGTLAANTAHEIKNPLTSINGFIDLARMKYNKKNQDHHFNIIKEELDRINNIVTQFLYLGKPTNLEYEKININDTIKQVIKFSEYELDLNKIHVSLSLPSEPTYVFLAEDQLKQILINLFQNSKDALSIRENSHITISLTQDDDSYATLIFQDNGIGISPELKHDIFEPFFTTKDSGSGLGLYLSKKLIEDWNGTIHVTSIHNKGTSFHIKLPFTK